MKKFPITILDNFYENPDLVRDYALSLQYYPSEDGAWPGLRTKLLSEIDPNFFKTFCSKLFGLFFDFENTKVDWEVETNFQKINSFSEDSNDIKNTGWIHVDDGCIFGGVIYLNPNPEQNWGTSIYTLKSGEFGEGIFKTKRLQYLRKEFDQDEYLLEKKNHDSKFIESIKIENLYNRIIAFESDVYHGVPSYYSKSNQTRLTQVFFVKELNSSGNFPVVRSRMSYD